MPDIYGIVATILVPLLMLLIVFSANKVEKSVKFEDYHDWDGVISFSFILMMVSLCVSVVWIYQLLAS